MQKEELRPRYPNALHVRLPRELSAAVDVTARARFMSNSEYIRQALLRSLRADGAVIPSPVGVAA